MSKKIIALIMLLSFVAQTFSAPFVLLDYYTNTGAYAKNCINKAKPKMHCNGRCQLMKKIKEQEKKEQENAERRSNNAKQEVLSTKSFYPNAFTPVFINIKAIENPAPYNLHINNFHGDFFHPPQVA